MRRVRAAVAMGLALLLVGAPWLSLRAQESPSKSVFSIVVMTHSNEGPSRSLYHSVASGTGFFISPDGTALTNSHVVYAARADRVTYQLLAIVGNEFYGATLVCASDLPEDPLRPSPQGVGMVRDVAEIRLTPPQFPFDQLLYRNIPYARAHWGPLPAFPPLTLGSDPNIGEPVRVLGFGQVTSPVPYEWSAEGVVSDAGRAPDGTPVFGIVFSRAAEPGHSGSPVLNRQDLVVGIYTWHKISDPTSGTAISRSALDPACRAPGPVRRGVRAGQERNGF
jgi:S1-C subfamily serine protease